MDHIIPGRHRDAIPIKKPPWFGLSVRLANIMYDAVIKNILNVSQHLLL